MAFIKAHLILLITGVATLAFIVVAVLGMMSDSVVQQMQERANLGRQLSALRTAPRNEEIIAAERNRVAQLQREYQEVSKVAEEINAHAPLMEGIFPAPERAALAYDFRDAYRGAVARLPRGKLAGGDLPSAAEIDAAKEEIAELEERRRMEQGDLGPMLPRVQAAPTAPPSTAAPFGTPAGRPGAIGQPGSTAGGAVAGDPSKDPVARARIAKAHNIRCYVSTDPASAGFGFSVSPLLESLGEPQPEEMWYAQVALWVEQDVAAAVAGLNDEAARALSPDQVYVENMPVKRLQSVYVLGYYTDKGELPFPTLSRTGSPAGSAYTGDSFTGRHCNKDFDVVRFTVVAVVDQRAQTQLINAITKQNCYQLIGVKYEALGAAATDYAEGYFYGTAPVARVTLDFEGYMARNVYAKWFPSEVRAALGIADGSSKDTRKSNDKGRPGRRRP
jgi:hypothetical protein